MDFEDSAASRHQNLSRNLWVSTKSVDFQNCFPDVALLEVERNEDFFLIWIEIRGFQAKSADFMLKSTAFQYFELSTPKSAHKSTDFTRNPRILHT